MNHKKKWSWYKIIILCVLMIVVVMIPSAATSAKTVSKKTLLKNSITYCDKMQESDYTAESWTSFQTQLEKAKAVYKKVKQADSVYKEAREELEKVKAGLMFLTTTEKGNPLLFRQLTSDQIVDEMGAGWNLGNTMDGHDSSWKPSETSWQSTVTTKKLIQAVHDLGFNTIRIPVTWGTMIDDSKDYTINDGWISRVQDIVDYAVSQDMYVIINIHHDGVGDQGGWLDTGADNIDAVYEKFEHVWRNIAERFKDYDEHLIFEDMNEVGYFDYFTDIKTVMNFNQIFVNVVRSTGSNNSQRWLSVPPRYTNIDIATNTYYGFDVPSDTVKNRIFVSVHDYLNDFGLTQNTKSTKFSTETTPVLADKYQQLVDRFTSKGIPVILGEYGAVNKNNTAERAYYYEVMSKVCRKDGIVACAWDNSYYDSTRSPDYGFALVDRVTGKNLFPDIVNAIMRGVYIPSTSKKCKEVVKNPKITEITQITTSDTALKMVIGDSKNVTATVKPSKTNDVVLWKTADATVATVSNGHVRARGIGSTILTAFSQSGSVKQEITITVNALSSSKVCTSIVTDKEDYSVAVGNYINLNAGMQPADSEDYLTFKSNDESVATVSAVGKIVGCAEGTTKITITAASGLVKTVNVTVITGTGNKAVMDNNKLYVALNVYYNDATYNYFKNEVGKAVEINGNGQYTVIFNCADDISRPAIDLGVKTLTNAGAIYLKDYRVTSGQLKKSGLVSCDIKYDKIVVDGKELTITQTSPKSAIKPDGVFDTNDPLNAWDGSCVKEAKTDNTKHVVNINGITNPKKMEITFTISNLVYEK